ncbi:MULTISPECIES: carboxymuconolactone decarboxylase family protein [unclassified Chelatococcus]|uniref:carboxymuconolactone decarboxylase family protein n=1 Tax=unclassified Chelatococcus TaxID=2638111 RepID=UPI001BCB21C3|nr:MULTISPECIES: carboxymuconolactone decarboxylase family protein [unclassified Chelatococcus]CAH1657355.1 AhpD family alkylhydroperoxidase [Hyphomicrobiales bacterium]MBS7742322.1 carboxymuconolactone decarboxylase family protein [Chelatococcus sp. HY11]MBX3542560.1 carboxymuconolactone decarboxylase family protein [Chelatococcus sp.]MCO5075223.1 carboxymuconolactone decarboxylase family protein [Chelatococcus sp.]CAH1689079.1 AhpD family alkylhydroperoxidase [Hyphomicrobiales bacterium]
MASSENLPLELKAMNLRFGALGKAAPQAMTAFRSLMGEASKAGVLPSSTKELIAVAIAVHQGCADCILFHVANARRHGASREELAEVLAVTIEMGGGPSAVYASRALEAFDTFTSEHI